MHQNHFDPPSLNLVRHAVSSDIPFGPGSQVLAGPGLYVPADYGTFYWTPMAVLVCLDIPGCNLASNDPLPGLPVVGQTFGCEFI